MATSTTFTAFLNQSAAEINVLQPGQSLPTSQLQFWAGAFNDMVRNMSADRLFLNYVPDVAYTCPGSAESYDIGVGASSFPTSGSTNIRPLFVESARAKVGTSRRWPLNVQTEQEFAANSRRGSSDPDGPIDFQYSASTVIGFFRFAPAPQSGQVIYISQWNPLKVFDPATEMALLMEDYYPLEYIRALKLNLAVSRAPSYKSAVSQELAGNAATALQTIRAENALRLNGSMGQSATSQAPAVVTGQAQQ